MTSKFFWITTSPKSRLAIAACPAPRDQLQETIKYWRSLGVEAVVCLLEPVEVAELQLSWESFFCAAQGIEFRSLPIPDLSLPPDADAFLAVVTSIAWGGKATVVHCRAGVGRSSMVAAGVLISLGIEAEAALTAIGVARGQSVPETAEQRDWIMAWAAMAMARKRL